MAATKAPIRSRGIGRCKHNVKVNGILMAIDLRPKQVALPSTGEKGTAVYHPDALSGPMIVWTSADGTRVRHLPVMKG